MKNKEINYQIALTLLKGIGPIKARQILTKVDSIESIFKETITSLANKTGVNSSILKGMNREKALADSSFHVDYLDKNNIQSLFYLDPQYPQRLKQCIDAPLILFKKGTVSLNSEKMVAIVGTRHASDYGKSVCEDMIKGFVGKNIVVTSGLAYGIDICIHQLCLKHGIPTIGVLGHGLDKMYPKEHSKTAIKMIDAGGLLTEYLPGTNPDRENFPMRNRIVAGMSDATIVIESKESGGSLITADLANEYSRDVFAIPGNVGQIYSKGCNLLISKQKAHLITGPTDFLNWMNWNEEQKISAVQTSLFHDFTNEEQSIFSTLNEFGELSIDIISLKIKMPVSKTSVLLFNLEMAGVLKTLPGKKYKLI